MDTPVTTSRILDLLAEACARAKVYGVIDASSWTWHRSMTANEHVAFDVFLVRMKDELAYQAGTPESRFQARVRRMVQP